MSTTENFITCPDCGCEINVNEALKHQIEVELQNKFDAEKNASQKNYQERLDAINKKEQELTDQKAAADLEFNNRLSQEKSKLEREIRTKLEKELEEENSSKFLGMKEELDRKSEKIKKLGSIETELEKIKREKEELKQSIMSEFEKKYNLDLDAEKKKIKKESDDANEMIVRQWKKKFDDQVKLTDQMKQKQEQESMQLQGEVQELAIEEFLNSNFPFDYVTEVKKGANGGDCIQIVNTREINNCGSIYYESKRAKNFSHSWIEKFKKDIQAKNVSLGVLVTEVLPAGMERMGLKDGIYICTYEEFKGLAFVLREFIVKMNRMVVVQENKEDKKELMFQYLTSEEFARQINSIQQGFQDLKDEMEREKRAMHKIWANREKHIDKVVFNTVGLYGSVRGIIGSKVKIIKELELDPDFDNEQ